MTETNTDARLGVEDAYRAHRLDLLRLAFLLTGSRDHSEDVVHSAFASAMTRWAVIDQPFAFLRRAVVNQAADWHRRRSRELRTKAPEGVTHLPEIDETWAEIQRLPPVQRQVVVLRFYADLSLVEIAELLDRPAATVRSDLRRALDRLRKVMGP